MRRIVIAGALLSHVDQDFLIHVAHVRDDLRSDLERCAGIVGFDLDDERMVRSRRIDDGP